MAVAIGAATLLAGLAGASYGEAGADGPRPRQAIDKLSNPQLVGQPVIVSYDGLEPPDEQAGCRPGPGSRRPRTAAGWGDGGDPLAGR